MPRFMPVFLASVLVILTLAASPSGADTPLPPPLTAVPIAQMTSQQKAQAKQVKSTLQGIYTKMDYALHTKNKGSFLNYRDAKFEEIDCHGKWRSVGNCRRDVNQLFGGLLSAKKRSVVQNVTILREFAEAFVTRHGSLVTLDPRSKQYENIIVDTVCRDIFVHKGLRWLQYRSYTMAEQVYVNGKLVRS